MMIIVLCNGQTKEYDHQVSGSCYDHICAHMNTNKIHRSILTPWRMRHMDKDFLTSWIIINRERISLECRNQLWTQYIMKYIFDRFRTKMVDHSAYLNAGFVQLGFRGFREGKVTSNEQVMWKYKPAKLLKSSRYENKAIHGTSSGITKPWKIYETFQNHRWPNPCCNV